eukprot:3939225-Rhodomonas_salina.1
MPNSSQQLVLDSSGFVEWLLERKWTRALGSKVATDDSGRLEKVFWVLEDSDALWTFVVQNDKHSNIQVLLFDTSHWTNRYGLKLGLLVTTDNTWVSHILAVSVITSEDKASFNWVFQCFN